MLAKGMCKPTCTLRQLPIKLRSTKESHGLEKIAVGVSVNALLQAILEFA